MSQRSNLSLKKYLRSLAEDLPHAVGEGYHVFGWRGMYLAACAFLLRRQPIPVSIPSFGRVTSWRESLNLIDNFAWRELRSARVENHLKRMPRAWVVDVGVNVGVTCRWWLSLAGTIDVIGIDMFQEALDFATERIATVGSLARWHPIAAAVGDSEAAVNVTYTDPLEGTSSLDAGTGTRLRSVHVRTLDSILECTDAGQIALLKLDIEGYAGKALRGASRTLATCDYVVVETHSEEETLSSSVALTGAGYQLFLCHGRTMWWESNRVSSAGPTE